MKTKIAFALFCGCNSDKKQTEAASANVGLTGTKWKLVKLNGKIITDDKAYISFSEENGRVSGNGGCNAFNGEFTVKEYNRITMSKVAATLMACPDMENESEFLRLLETVDNYTIHNDTLSLNKARMAPLAVFAADTE